MSDTEYRTDRVRITDLIEALGATLSLEDACELGIIDADEMEIIGRRRAEIARADRERAVQAERELYERVRKVYEAECPFPTDRPSVVEATRP